MVTGDQTYVSDTAAIRTPCFVCDKYDKITSTKSEQISFVTDHLRSEQQHEQVAQEEHGSPEDSSYAGFYHVSPNLGKIMEGKFHKPTLHNILIPFKGDEIKGKVQVVVDNEVGTSRRTNYQRNSGYQINFSYIRL